MPAKELVRMGWQMWLAMVAKWLAKIHAERERTARKALDRNDRTVRYIAILLTRGLIVSGLAVLVIVAYVIWRLI